MPYRRSGGDVDVVAERDRSHERCVAADLYAITDHGRMLFEPIVVADDCASADIGIPAHRDVAEVRQMIWLRAFAEYRLFGLDEVADVDAIGKRCPRSEVSKRADHRVIADLRFRDHHRELQMHAVAELGIIQVGATVDAAVLAYPSPAP